jgi:hypothetical protein
VTKKIRTKEGDVFVLPVDEKFAIGLTVRLDKSRIALGYFYKSLFEINDLTFESLNIDFRKPILIKQFGIQGFNDGTWKIIAKLPEFKRDDFPVPEFFYMGGADPQLVYFNNEMNETGRKFISTEEVDKFKNYLAQAGLAGSVALEILLKKRIDIDA